MPQRSRAGESPRRAPAEPSALRSAGDGALQDAPAVPKAGKPGALPEVAVARWCLSEAGAALPPRSCRRSCETGCFAARFWPRGQRVPRCCDPFLCAVVRLRARSGLTGARSECARQLPAATLRTNKIGAEQLRRDVALARCAGSGAGIARRNVNGDTTAATASSSPAVLG